MQNEAPHDPEQGRIVGALLGILFGVAVFFRSPPFWWLIAVALILTAVPLALRHR